MVSMPNSTFWQRCRYPTVASQARTDVTRVHTPAVNRARRTITAPCSTAIDVGSVTWNHGEKVDLPVA